MISFFNNCSGFLKKFRFKGPLVQGFWKIFKRNSCFGFLKIFKEPDWFYGRTGKRTKTLRAKFFDQFSWFFEIYSYEWKSVLWFSENCCSGVHNTQTFSSVLSSKKKEDRTVFCYGKCFFSKWQKFRFPIFLIFKIFRICQNSILSSNSSIFFNYLFFYCHI